ncbi:MAG: hypothetical protein P0S93_05380 [Candidatus Neptunochlamydia sp.]|nr:hypothetical protein [Candidatus Neptunochlamydia sp.]
MNHRQLLLEARKSRDTEIEEYISILNKIGSPTSKEWEEHRSMLENNNLLRNDGAFLLEPHQLSQQIRLEIEKRKMILDLELPYVTTTVSVNSARVEYSKKNQKEEILIDQKIESRFSTDDTDDEDSEGTDKFISYYKKNSLRNLLNSSRPLLLNISYDSNGNETRVLEQASDEDLESSTVRQELFKIINNKQVKDKTKKVQLSQIRQLLSHRYSITNAKKGAPLDILASYFRYIEKRCLQSYKIQPFKDLLEVRLLSYIPLPIGSLQMITLEDINSVEKTINADGRQFPVPETVIQMAKSLFLSPQEPLFKRDSNKIHKFILQTSESAKIPLSLTPTLIKNSLADICSQEHFYKEFLPRR